MAKFITFVVYQVSCYITTRCYYTYPKVLNAITFFLKGPCSITNVLPYTNPQVLCYNFPQTITKALAICCHKNQLSHAM